MSRHRTPGRPATLQDKNRRPMPIRAHRDQPMKWFFESMPSDTFEEALESSDDPKFRRLYAALQDPAYQTTSRMTLCRNFGISLRDLLDLWFGYMRDLARLEVFKRLPEVVADTVEDALSREVACGRCDGSGAISKDDGQRRCPMCEGGGKVRVPGNAEARQMVLEIGGLIGRNKGAVVAIQQNVALNLEDGVNEVGKIFAEPEP